MGLEQYRSSGFIVICVFPAPVQSQIKRIKRDLGEFPRQLATKWRILA